MPKTKDLPLIDPIRGHETEIKVLTFREPGFIDLVELGEPVAMARSEGGLTYAAERDEVVRAYCERLLVEPKDPGLLAQVGLADGLRLKDLIFGFFKEARERTTSS